MDPKTRQRMEQLVEDRQPAPEHDSEKVRGVGDVVARVTKAVGIQPCEPCNRRRQWLNRYFPIK